MFHGVLHFQVFSFLCGHYSFADTCCWSFQQEQPQSALSPSPPPLGSLGLGLGLTPLPSYDLVIDSNRDPSWLYTLKTDYQL